MSPRLYRRIASGFLAGCLASIPMMLLLMLVTSSLDDSGAISGGQSGLLPIELIAATLLGEAALLPEAGIGTWILGSCLHLFVGGFFGALLGTITLTRSPVKLLVTSLIYSSLIWASMQFLILPLGVNFPLAIRMPEWLFGLSHLIYGIGLLATLPIERRLTVRDVVMIEQEQHEAELERQRERDRQREQIRKIA